MICLKAFLFLCFFQMLNNTPRRCKFFMPILAKIKKNNTGLLAHISGLNGSAKFIINRCFY